MNVNDKIQDGIAALQKLWALYHDEHDGAQWTRRTDMPTVSSSGKSDPTGQVAAVGQREQRAEQIKSDIGWVVGQIEEKVDRYEPKQTGNCITEGCIREGISTWGGRCEKCGPWMYANPGWDPAEMVDEETGRSLVDDWNRTATRDCGCPDWCCAPGDCLDRIKPDGSAPRTSEPVSDRCRKRMQRVRETADA